MEITKEDWVKNKFENEILIKVNYMQIDMARKVIELCEQKISEFPPERLEVPENPKQAEIPLGVQ